jgi:hypothetical protein
VIRDASSLSLSDVTSPPLSTQPSSSQLRPAPFDTVALPVTAPAAFDVSLWLLIFSLCQQVEVCAAAGTEHYHPHDEYTLAARFNLNLPPPAQSPDCKLCKTKRAIADHPWHLLCCPFNPRRPLLEPMMKAMTALGVSHVGGVAVWPEQQQSSQPLPSGAAPDVGKAVYVASEEGGTEKGTWSNKTVRRREQRRRRRAAVAAAAAAAAATIAAATKASHIAERPTSRSTTAAD